MTSGGAGYSGTPLAKKLGVQPGFRLKTRNAPADYRELLAPLPENVSISTRFAKEVDLWHLFTSSERELRRLIPVCLAQIRQNGMIWVSWPKKASGIPSEVNGDTVRAVALPLDLVDIKVCAIDDTWSGLKLVIRKESRREGTGEVTSLG